jgi:beta-lactamase regulating signal transducer with metallopeptidase domain
MSALVAMSAELLSLAAWFIGAPRRFVWLTAVLVAAGVPLALPARTWPTGIVQSAKIQSGTGRSPTKVQLSVDRNTARQKLRLLSTHSETIIAVADRSFVVLWAIWSLVLVVSLVRAMIALRRQLAQCSESETEFGRVLVARDGGPAVIGWLHPQIVIPSWVTTVDAQTQMLVLRHEAEHVRAGDTRLLLFGEVARRLVPWNISLAWMVNRLRLSIELDCDARVIRTLGAPRPYGAMLLTVSERISPQPDPVMSPLVTHHDLEHRLDTLAAKRRRRPALSALTYAAVASVLLATVAWTPRPGFPPTGASPVVHVDSSLVRVGYEKRKASARGQFHDGASIDRRSGRFSDAFRAIPGLRVSPSGDGRTNVIASANSDAECVQAFIDGAAWQTAIAGDIDDFVSATQIVAIEVYHPRDVPEQFARDNPRNCMSLVVWTQAIDRRR